MRVKMLPVLAIATALLVGMCASSESVSAADYYETGDVWIYDITMNMESMLLSGTYSESFSRESSRSVAGYVYSTYELTYQGTLTVTGSLFDYPVTGTATISGFDSIEQQSMNLVTSDYNLSMTLSVDIGYPVSYEYWEHNVSTYSPPGGVGDEPEDPDEGTSWSKTYTAHCETMMNDDGYITEWPGSFSLTETYTYLGVQTITVPAGTFECDVIQTDDGDSIWTDWYSEDAGTYVKSSYEDGSSQTGTELLKSYSYTPPPSDGVLSTMVMLLVAGVVVAAIVAVVVLWVLMKRRTPPNVEQIGPIAPEPGPPTPPAG